jgi:hypothetical protein
MFVVYTTHVEIQISWSMETAEISFRAEKRERTSSGEEPKMGERRAMAMVKRTETIY